MRSRPRPSPAPPIRVRVFATGAARPGVAASAPVLAHTASALRSGARGAFGRARPSANPHRAAGGAGLEKRVVVKPDGRYLIYYERI